MAYCSFCAAPLEANQTMCNRCGRSPEAVASAGRPGSVTTAGILLTVAFVLGILSLGGLLLRPGIIPLLPMTYWIRTIGVSALWIVVLLCYWQRQGWARIGIVLLTLWAVGNLMLALTRNLSLAALSFSLAFALLLAILRIGAVVLMFTPASNAWFKRS
jgi:hypothetical protein